jgi:hypothetical protein
MEFYLYRYFRIHVTVSIKLYEIKFNLIKILKTLNYCFKMFVDCAVVPYRTSTSLLTVRVLQTVEQPTHKIPVPFRHQYLQPTFQNEAKQTRATNLK